MELTFKTMGGNAGPGEKSSKQRLCFLETLMNLHVVITFTDKLVLVDLNEWEVKMEGLLLQRVSCLSWLEKLQRVTLIIPCPGKARLILTVVVVIKNHPTVFI